MKILTIKLLLLVLVISSINTRKTRKENNLFGNLREDISQKLQSDWNKLVGHAKELYTPNNRAHAPCHKLVMGNRVCLQIGLVHVDNQEAQIHFQMQCAGYKGQGFQAGPCNQISNGFYAPEAGGFNFAGVGYTSNPYIPAHNPSHIDQRNTYQHQKPFRDYSAQQSLWFLTDCDG